VVGDVLSPDGELPPTGAGVSGEVVVATSGFRREEVGIEAA